LYCVKLFAETKNNIWKQFNFQISLLTKFNLPLQKVTRAVTIVCNGTVGNFVIVKK